jgi:hypothetical protein
VYADGHATYSPTRNVPFTILQSFTATRVDNNALLQWNTYIEKNTVFVLEKSADSVHYSTFVIMPAMGDTNSVNSYGVMDNNLWNGNNYYRLKIKYTDKDSIYSPVRNVPFDPDGFVVSIYPNPVAQRATLYINTSVNCKQIALFDISGRLIQLLDTSGFQHTLYTGKLAKGVYFVSIKTDAGKKIKKIIVE